MNANHRAVIFCSSLVNHLISIRLNVRLSGWFTYTNFLNKTVLSLKNVPYQKVKQDIKELMVHKGKTGTMKTRQKQKHRNTQAYSGRQDAQSGILKDWNLPKCDCIVLSVKCVNGTLPITFKWNSRQSSTLNIQTSELCHEAGSPSQQRVKTRANYVRSSERGRCVNTESVFTRSWVTA